MERVETKLDTIIGQLAGIATRSDMRNYVLTAVGLMIAIVAILVGSMGWLEGRAARIQPPAAAAPQPIVIQLPAQPVAPAPTKGKGG